MKGSVVKKTKKIRPVKCAICTTKECHYEGLDCFDGKGNPRNHFDEEDRKILACASEIEAEYYFQMTRVEEVIEFGRRMNFSRLGVAFCIGLETEARVLHKILSNHFEVFSVCCKACGIDKKDLGLKQIKKARFETMCNPIGQALLLDSEKTELNIILGLCIGHDILFTRHSRAPVTTLVVKDRILAHNPVGALYSGYHKRLKFGLDERRSQRTKTGS